MKEKKLAQMKVLKEKNEALGMGGLMKQTAEIGNLGAVFNVRVSYSNDQPRIPQVPTQDDYMQY